MDFGLTKPAPPIVPFTPFRLFYILLNSQPLIRPTVPLLLTMPSSSAPSSRVQLPPLPSRPYSPDTLAAYIHAFTLPDPIDRTSGDPWTMTSVESWKCRAWGYRSIRFSLDEEMLLAMAERLRWLLLERGLDAQTRFGDEPTAMTIRSEHDVGEYLNEIKRRSAVVCRRYQDEGRVERYGYPVWHAQLSGSSRPDWRLYIEREDGESEKRPRMMEIKKMVHLRSVLKLLVRMARRKRRDESGGGSGSGDNAGGEIEGFELLIGEDGTTRLGEGFEDVSGDDRERIRKLLTQVSKAPRPTNPQPP